MKNTEFTNRYGPWALILGGSKGIGLAFARQLAEKGLNLVLVARDEIELQKVAGELDTEVRTLSVDLAADDVLVQVRAAVANLEIGLLVYNAALAPIRPFLETELEDHLRTISVNCRGPVAFSYSFGSAMVERGRGGIILMSSMAGFQGSAMISTYAASKAFDTVLGEGLWEEFRQHGVDVLAMVAGATRTPTFLDQTPLEKQSSAFPREPDEVASEALESLGRNPSRIAGPINKLAGFVLSRVLPRRSAIEFMSRTNRRLFREQ